MRIPFRLFLRVTVTPAAAVVLLAGAILGGPCVIAFAQSSNIPVPGAANPWLAAGTSAAAGDVAPAQSPVLVSLADFAAGDELAFAANGSVSFAGGTPTNPPDGDLSGFRSLFHLMDSTNGGPENGLAGLNAPANSLVGVFLAANDPSSGGTPPAFFNFAPDGNVTGNINYTTLEPAIAQPFFIGDGYNAAGMQQRVKVPVGATRLFLGSMDGAGWFNNSGAFTVTVGLAGVVPPPPPVPEHGGLSASVFEIDGRATPSSEVADTALHFSAKQSGTPEGLKVRVQFNTTANNKATDWIDLANGSSGYMTLDKTTGQFVLTSTNYPLANGIYFRALSTAPGYSESKSNVIGPFNLSAAQNHLGRTVLTLATNGPGAEMKFRSTVQTDQATLTLYIQSTITPNDDASWVGLNDGRTGQMYTYADHLHFFLDTSKYPPGAQVYFRAVAKAVGFVDSYSNIIGVKNVVVGARPDVEITPLTTPVSGNDGTSAMHPLVYNFGTIRFNARLDPTINFPRQIKKISLFYDGAQIDSLENGATSITTDYITSVPGDHVIKAIATDELGIRGFAPPVYIRVKPRGGKVFTMTNSGSWSTAANWLDELGHSGIPGAQDLAIIVGKNATISNDVSALAISLLGGSINGSSGALNVGGILSIASGALKNINLAINPNASMVLSGDENVPISGAVTNNGTIRVTGRGSIVPVPPAAQAETDALGQNNFFEGIAAFFKNAGDFIFHRPSVKPAASPAPQATPAPAPLPRGVAASAFENHGRLITNDGGSLITNDGGSAVSDNQASLIGNDGASLITNDGGSVIGNDGASLIGNDGASLITNDGGSRPAFITEAVEATTGFVQVSGETDLSNLQILSSVTLNGGTLTGSGVIVGSLTNNSGYISPGHSAGTITVTGVFQQAAGGTLIVENGGLNMGSSDQLRVEGSAALAGNLHVRSINGYAQGAGDAFSPLAYDSVSGNFGSTGANAALTLNASGVLAVVNPAAAQPQPGQPANISTRMRVLTGDKVLIGGFIVKGAAGTTKAVLIRGKGPSLTNAGLSGLLADPLLELHLPGGATVTNDNWGTAPNKDRIPNGFAPTSPKESIIIADLAPGNYTVIERGADGGSGIGLTEIYDIDGNKEVKLANISTRGFVDTGDNVLIGGFIVSGTEPAGILVRARGPSLTGLSGVLADPMLELHDGNGNVFTNDDWRETQESEIAATTIPPTNNKEAAILATLVPGNYTAIVRGKDNTTGIGLVEVYKVK